MEYVLQVHGVVRRRPEGTDNPEMSTGTIDVVADRVEILNASKVPPFLINRDENIDELRRMQYRYLDLRRPNMQQNMILRHRTVKFLRDFLDGQGFIEIETPILFKTTPERARLPCAEPLTAGQVLRAAAVPAAAQAAAHGGRLREILSGRALLPR